MSQAAFKPYTPRYEKVDKGIFQIFSRARRNLLTVFSDSNYKSNFLKIKIFRRQVFIANSPEIVKHILLKNHVNYESKSPQMRRALELLLGDGLFISDGPVWAIRRSLVTPIIHNKNLHLFTDTMVEIAEEIAGELENIPEQESRDMVDICARMTAKIICGTVFGKNLDQQDAQMIIDGFAAYQKHIDVLNLPYFLGLDNGMPVFKGLALRRATKAVRGTISKIVDAISKQQDQDADRPMIHMLLDARTPDGNPLTTEEIVNEAATLFMAGYETTAATLAWASYLLASDPATESKVLDELNSILGGRAPTLADVPKLTYTRAVIDETLRLYPPVPFLMRQAVNSDKISDNMIPAKSLVGVVPWLLHRNPNIWENPDHFIPERFLDKTTQPFSYIPFAMGPRICAGASFGLTESVLCLAVIVQRLSMRIKDGWDVKPLCHLTLKPDGGLPMHFKSRKDNITSSRRAKNVPTNV